MDDVTNQAETTAEAPSAENETIEMNQEQPSEANTAQDDSMNEVKTVPYDRFAEVIQSKNELSQRLSELEKRIELSQQAPQAQIPPNPEEQVVKQQLDKYLKEMGYVSKQELEEKEADQKLEQKIESLSSKYNGKDGRPKFDRSKVLNYAADHLIGDIEVAYEQLNKAALIDYEVKQAIAKSRGVKTEISDGSGSANVGTTQDDLYKAASSGDGSAFRTLIKRALS